MIAVSPVVIFLHHPVLMGPLSASAAEAGEDGGDGTHR